MASRPMPPEPNAQPTELIFAVGPQASLSMHSYNRRTAATYQRGRHRVG